MEKTEGRGGRDLGGLSNATDYLRDADFLLLLLLLTLPSEREEGVGRPLLRSCPFPSCLRETAPAKHARHMFSKGSASQPPSEQLGMLAPTPSRARRKVLPPGLAFAFACLCLSHTQQVS